MDEMGRDEQMNRPSPCATSFSFLNTLPALSFAYARTWSTKPTFSPSSSTPRGRSAATTRVHKEGEEGQVGEG